jgi:hypothetical protein
MMLAIGEIFVYFGKDEVEEASLCGDNVIFLTVFQIV